MINTQVREARVCDCDSIARLYHDVWHETHAPMMPSEAAYLRPLVYFKARTLDIVERCLIGTHANKLVGFVAWQENRIGQLWLLPKMRGSGLAKVLLEQALVRLFQSGYSSAALECFAKNERGLRFYQREGWVKAGLINLPVAANSSIAAPFWQLIKQLRTDVRL